LDCIAGFLADIDACQRALERCSNGCVLPPVVGSISSQIDTATGAVEVYFITADTHVRQWRWLASTGWTQLDFKSSIGAPDAALAAPLAVMMDTPNSRPEVYYTGGDSHVHQIYWDSVTGWHQFDVGGFTNAPNNSSGFRTVDTLMDTVTGRPEIYYATSTGDLEQLYWDSVNGWQAADITTLTGGPGPGANGAVTTLIDTVTHAPEIWFVGTDMHIHQTAWNTTTGWHNFDISAAAGSVNAPLGGGISVLVDSLTGNRLEAYYIGGDQHIHQLYFTGTSWGTADITTATEAEPTEVAGPITAKIDSFTGQLEIYYVDDNLDIRQLSWTSSQGWNSFDVSNFTGAPTAAPLTSLSSLNDTVSGEFEIYFTADDAHLHQLSWSSTNGWRHFDVTAGH
jgi:hypothetical protein